MSTASVLGGVLLLAAQLAPPPSLSFDAVRTTVAQAASITPDRVQQLTIDWTGFAGAAGALVSTATAVPVNRFQIRDRRTIAGSLPVDRNPELSADQLVVIGSGGQGQALSWQLIRDPRVVRAEQPGPDGLLSGQTLMRTDVQLLLALPDTPQLTDVRLYQPRWDGARWSLDLIASFPVSQR